MAVHYKSDHSTIGGKGWDILKNHRARRPFYRMRSGTVWESVNELNSQEIRLKTDDKLTSYIKTGSKCSRLFVCMCTKTVNNSKPPAYASASFSSPLFLKQKKDDAGKSRPLNVSIPFRLYIFMVTYRLSPIHAWLSCILTFIVYPLTKIAPTDE